MRSATMRRKVERSPYLAWSASTGDVVLVRCPACEADLSDRRASYHLFSEHRPEDFGLSPLRREPADVEAAILGGGD